MSNNNTEDAVYQHTERLFRQEAASNSLVPQKGKLARPISVHSPEGQVHSWFVAVTLEDRIAGFFQLSPDLTLLRYASFLRHPGSIAASPSSGSWLDPEQITARAARLLRPGEVAELRYLTYDQNPDRLAWQVNAHSPDGTTRTIFVAGDYAYQK